MLLTTLLPLAFLGVAIASPIAQTPAIGAESDAIGTIVNGYYDIQETIIAYDEALKALPSNATLTATSSANFHALSRNITSALAKAQKNVEGITVAIDIFQAIGLQAPGDQLMTTLENFITDLIGKKDLFAGAQQMNTVLEELKAQKDAATGFSNAVNNKLPGIAVMVANVTSQRSKIALDKGINAFT